MSDLPKTDEYERVLLDALWSDGRYHVDPRRVVLAANAMHDELVAALALRDLMLRDIIERIALTPERWNGWTTEEVLTDLRARAEKEAER
jgi:hypothetical protein